MNATERSLLNATSAKPACVHTFSDGHHGTHAVRCDRCGSAACKTCNGTGSAHTDTGRHSDGTCYEACPTCAGKRTFTPEP